MIEPFENAIEYMTWDEHNCCRCVKYGVCDIQLELETAAITGEIDDDIATRAGLPGDVCLEMVKE